ncbi:MAG: hypothetical protein ACFFD4_24370 [Candidatus Odinarchaeota archaeon]
MFILAFFPSDLVEYAEDTVNQIRNSSSLKIRNEKANELLEKIKKSKENGRTTVLKNLEAWEYAVQASIHSFAGRAGQLSGDRNYSLSFSKAADQFKKAKEEFQSVNPPMSILCDAFRSISIASGSKDVSFVMKYLKRAIKSFDNYTIDIPHTYAKVTERQICKSLNHYYTGIRWKLAAENSTQLGRSITHFEEASKNARKYDDFLSLEAESNVYDIKSKILRNEVNSYRNKLLNEGTLLRNYEIPKKAEIDESIQKAKAAVDNHKKAIKPMEDNTINQLLELRYETLNQMQHFFNIVYAGFVSRNIDVTLEEIKNAKVKTEGMLNIYLKLYSDDEGISIDRQLIDKQIRSLKAVYIITEALKKEYESQKKGNNTLSIKLIELTTYLRRDIFDYCLHCLVGESKLPEWIYYILYSYQKAYYEFLVNLDNPLVDKEQLFREVKRVRLLTDVSSKIIDVFKSRNTENFDRMTSRALGAVDDVISDIKEDLIKYEDLLCELRGIKHFLYAMAVSSKGKVVPTLFFSKEVFRNLKSCLSYNDEAIEYYRKASGFFEKIKSDREMVETWLDLCELRCLNMIAWKFYKKALLSHYEIIKDYPIGVRKNIPADLEESVKNAGKLYNESVKHFEKASKFTLLTTPTSSILEARSKTCAALFKAFNGSFSTEEKVFSKCFDKAQTYFEQAAEIYRKAGLYIDYITNLMFGKFVEGYKQFLYALNFYHPNSKWEKSLAKYEEAIISFRKTIEYFEERYGDIQKSSEAEHVKQFTRLVEAYKEMAEVSKMQVEPKSKKEEATPTKVNDLVKKLNAIIGNEKGVLSETLVALLHGRTKNYMSLNEELKANKALKETQKYLPLWNGALKTSETKESDSGVEILERNQEELTTLFQASKESHENAAVRAGEAVEFFKRCNYPAALNLTIWDSLYHYIWRDISELLDLTLNYVCTGEDDPNRAKLIPRIDSDIKSLQGKVNENEIDDLSEDCDRLKVALNSMRELIDVAKEIDEPRSSNRSSMLFGRLETVIKECSSLVPSFGEYIGPCFSLMMIVGEIANELKIRVGKLELSRPTHNMVDGKIIIPFRIPISNISRYRYDLKVVSVVIASSSPPEVVVIYPTFRDFQSFLPELNYFESKLIVPENHFKDLKIPLKVLVTYTVGENSGVHIDDCEVDLEKSIWGAYDEFDEFSIEFVPKALRMNEDDAIVHTITNPYSIPTEDIELHIESEELEIIDALNLEKIGENTYIIPEISPNESIDLSIVVRPSKFGIARITLVFNERTSFYNQFEVKRNE